ncbi:unnamed protein product [Onchocerca flexuosa]|uniref:Ovule protein n=1 Tax=Onchocerca flexuosa TaxID=387005 RepID=A0A183I547_9BILA|nr:unnamed protein product [Onchocerca flexuosa]
MCGEHLVFYHLSIHSSPESCGGAPKHLNLLCHHPPPKASHKLSKHCCSSPLLIGHLSKAPTDRPIKTMNKYICSSFLPPISVSIFAFSFIHSINISAFLPLENVLITLETLSVNSLFSDIPAASLS